MERLAEHDDEHRAVRASADLRHELPDIRGAEERREFLGGRLGTLHPRIEVDLRAEVVVARRVGPEAVRRLERLVAALGEQVTGAPGRALHAVPVQDEHARLLRSRSLLLDLLSERDRRRLLRGAHVRVAELAHGALDVLRRGRQVGEPLEPADPGLEHVPGRQRVCERRVTEHRPRADVLPTALADLDVRRDHLDHLRELGDRERVLDLILERAHEELLARGAVDVRVRVAEADEVERPRPVEALVAGLEVDLRVAGRAAVVVVVAPVDVQPDTTELVDELPEPTEVDRDDVVDRQARQVADGAERPDRAAGRVRGVDLRRERRVAGTVDRDVQVAGEREERDRLLPRVRAHQHQGVGARRCVLPLVGAVVVAEHERGRGLAGESDLQRLERLLHLGRARRDGCDSLMEVEVRAARGAADQHGEHERRPAEDRERERAAAPGRRRRLAVDRDRPERRRRDRSPTVAVQGRAAADSSLQRRSHG